MIQTNRKRRTARLIGAVSVAAMAFGFAPFSPISPAGAQDVANLCPVEGQTDAFTDDDGNTHEENIDCGEALDIINGTTPTTFDPDGDLTRGQAASLLVQLVEAANCGVELTVGQDQFPDDEDSVHEENINKAANNNILEGFDDGTFRPTVAVTRGQFASIVVQAVEETIGSQLTDDGQDDFDDDDDSVHQSNIEKAADNNLLEGFGNRTFAPGDDIDRDQAATILIRTVEFLFDDGFFHCEQAGAATALTLTPDTDINPVGASHTVTANLTDANDDASQEGELVRFEVYRDSDDGAAESSYLFFATGGFDTATGGTADFTYTGPATNEQDVIVSCVVPNRQTGCTDDTFLTRNSTGAFNNITADVFDTAEKEWTQRQASALALTPETDINPVGTDHTVTATVTDQFGAPVTDTFVTFEVFRDTDFDGNFEFVDQADTITGGTATQGEAGITGPGTINPALPASNQPDGVTTFTFTGTQGGLYRVVACTDADGDGDCATITNVSNPGPSGKLVLDPAETAIDTADKEFVTAQNAAAGTFTGTVQECASPNVRIFTEDGRNLTFVTESTDQFTVGGSPATQAGFFGQCTPGDQLTTNYNPATGVQSTFSLTNA